MLITEILSRNARMYGDEVALIERVPAENRRTEISWSEFDTIAHKVSNALVSKNAAKGAKVVHLMMNCLEWLPIYFGILRTGAVAVPLNFRFGSKTISSCIRTAEASVIFFGEEFIDRIDAVKHEMDTCLRTYIFVGSRDKCPGYAHHYDDIIAEAPAHPLRVDISILDDASLYFTSGTTGEPKAALLTHRNLEFACFVENRHHRQTHEDRFLCIPPLYHTGAKMHWFGSFIVGGRAVILKGIEPRWILETVSEERITIVWLLVPWALDILLAIESGEINLGGYNLDQWRLMHIGAQPVPKSLVQEWLKIFPHHQYDTNYGLTESTGPGCVHLGIGNIDKVGAIGIPGFDWEYQIVDSDLNPVPPETPGELILKGAGVMKEYYNNPEATGKAIVDGWLLTGDIAKVDRDGFIWLVDRKKDVVITGGENIYPVEIEDFLQAHPRIKDVAVIGLPSSRLGEIAAAIIEPKPGSTLTEEEVLTFCKDLPRYKRPRKIIFDEVPRNPTGKIEKPRLRKKYTGSEKSFTINP